MDFRRIDEDLAGPESLHIADLPLDVRVLSADELGELLRGTSSGEEIIGLISDGVRVPSEHAGWEDEFGGPDATPVNSDGTWTLAILSSLKDAGKELQAGWIRWLLRTALPLGTSMAAVFNGDLLIPSKVDANVADEWILGENLGLTSVSLPDEDVRDVQELSDPIPHVVVDGVPGMITGRARLYQERITGGKSDLNAASNGFHVNILGRVINLNDPYFGIENLNHSSWSKFRATVRADGLDGLLAVNREGIQGGAELNVLQALLRALFNKARSAHDAAVRAAWPDTGDVLTESWSAVPLEPLRRVVAEGLASAAGLPAFVDASGIDDREQALSQWAELEEHPQDIIEEVTLESLSSDEPLVKYDVANRKVIVNRSHPFAREHSETHEQQLLLRDAALVELLSQASMLEFGISQAQLREILEYKDQTFRLVAQVRRRSGVQIAELLIGSTAYSKALERILGDAIEYLGFAVETLGQPGEPEGIAIAPIPPLEGDTPTTYRFTYDAKSSASGTVTTGNLKASALARHRRKHNADHTLAVGPDFQLGALQEECEANSITPMRARDLAALIVAAGAFGPINLSAFRSVFELHDPNEVHAWVEETAEQLRIARRLSLDLVLTALEQIGYEGPNAV